MFLFCGFAILKEGQEKLMRDGYMQLKGFSFLILSMPSGERLISTAALFCSYLKKSTWGAM
jgi:hypothetical protein